MIEYNAPSLLVKSRINVDNQSIEKVFLYRYWCKIVKYNVVFVNEPEIR